MEIDGRDDSASLIPLDYARPVSVQHARPNLAPVLISVRTRVALVLDFALLLYFICGYRSGAVTVVCAVIAFVASLVASIRAISSRGRSGRISIAVYSLLIAICLLLIAVFLFDIEQWIFPGGH